VNFRQLCSTGILSTDATRATQAAILKFGVQDPSSLAMDTRPVIRTVRRMPVTLHSFNEFPEKFMMGVGMSPTYSTYDINHRQYEFKHEEKQVDVHSKLYEPPNSSVIQMRKPFPGVWAKFKDIWKIEPSGFRRSLLSFHKEFPYSKKAKERTKRATYSIHRDTTWNFVKDTPIRPSKKTQVVKPPSSNEVSCSRAALADSPTPIDACALKAAHVARLTTLLMQPCTHRGLLDHDQSASPGRAFAVASYAPEIERRDSLTDDVTQWSGLMPRKDFHVQELPKYGHPNANKISM
jgi:hypothetical protein